MRYFLTGVAITALAGPAFAQNPVLSFDSTTDGVSIVRGADVMSAVDRQSLLGGDLIVSSAQGQYTLQLENCAHSVSGEAVVKVSDVTCESDGRDNTGAYVTLGFGLVVLGIMNNDSSDDSSNPIPVSP